MLHNYPQYNHFKAQAKNNTTATIGSIHPDDQTSDITIPFTLVSQVLDYPATAFGYQFNDLAGADALDDHVNTTAALCPATRIALSGFAQGAQIIYLAAHQLDMADNARALSAISSNILFSSFYHPIAVAGIDAHRQRSLCLELDAYCHRKNRAQPHLYRKYVDETPGCRPVCA